MGGSLTIASGKGKISGGMVSITGGIGETDTGGYILLTMGVGTLRDSGNLLLGSAGGGDKWSKWFDKIKYWRCIIRRQWKDIYDIWRWI